MLPEPINGLSEAVEDIGIPYIPLGTYARGGKLILIVFQPNMTPTSCFGGKLESAKKTISSFLLLAETMVGCA